MTTKRDFKFYELFNIRISRNVIKMVSVLYRCPLISKLVAGNKVNLLTSKMGSGERE
jgi:hypothetical protein